MGVFFFCKIIVFNQEKLAYKFPIFLCPYEIWLCPLYPFQVVLKCRNYFSLDCPFNCVLRIVLSRTDKMNELMPFVNDLDWQSLECSPYSDTVQDTVHDYRPRSKASEGYVFTGVCHSLCSTQGVCPPGLVCLNTYLGRPPLNTYLGRPPHKYIFRQTPPPNYIIGQTPVNTYLGRPPLIHI